MFSRGLNRHRWADELEFGTCGNRPKVFEPLSDSISH